MRRVEQWQLRAGFAARMAQAYGTEVPAYNTLVDVAAQVNADVIARDGAAAERLGSIGRVTAERHGAIRVGTPNELRQVSRIFAALGMSPVGFYDLRDAARSAVPVVSTAFRPIDAAELARNPFRMFASVLVTDDRRFFTTDLQRRLDTFLARRQLFPPELIALCDTAIHDRHLSSDDAEQFLKLATAAFELSAEPIDRAWYAELERISSVAADIGGVSTTHINHLTPRVLDIDELYRRMSERGISMIDTIQGPPRWNGPDVLLRQTSFRALAEPRRFREADRSLTTGDLRVRFGEVEARGIALTRSGRDKYDAMLAMIDERLVEEPDVQRAEVAAQVWSEQLPADEQRLLRDGWGFWTVSVRDRSRAVASDDPWAQVDAGALDATPIVYEDFLPRSAAGIFQSNLTAHGTKHTAVEGSVRDAAWLAGVLDHDVAEPMDLYERQQRSSTVAAMAVLQR